MRNSIRAAIMLLLSGLYALVGAEARAASPREPEEIWQELLKLPSEERQKRLVAGARAEGKAVFFGNISADHLERLQDDFEKRYGVKLEGYRASGEQTANRLLTEARAGKLDVDVLAPSNERPRLSGDRYRSEGNQNTLAHAR